MDDKEKKRWFITAIIGTVFMGLCLVISIMQYFVYKISAPLFIERYIALFINLISFFCFVVLIFTPTHFGIYFVIFYLYGCGNLLDQGNILGALCIFISILFLKKMNLLKQKKRLNSFCFRFCRQLRLQRKSGRKIRFTSWYPCFMSAAWPL